MMIVDLAQVGSLSDKERKHMEMSIYVGYALERAQKFEQAVALVIALSRARDRLEDDAAFRHDVTRLMSKRMVELLARAVEMGLITQEVAEHCETARKKRNQFVHGFFREHDLHTKQGLLKAFWDVQQAHSLFDAVQGLIAERVPEIISSLGFTDAEVEQSNAVLQQIQQEDWA